MIRAAQAHRESGARHARLAQRGCRRFRYFDGAVKQIFARGKDRDAMTKVMRGVGIEPEVAVQQIRIRIVVVHAAAHAALQAQRAERAA